MFNVVPTLSVTAPHPGQSTDVLTVGNGCNDIVVLAWPIAEIDTGVGISGASHRPLCMGRHGTKQKNAGADE